MVICCVEQNLKDQVWQTLNCDQTLSWKSILMHKAQFRHGIIYFVISKCHKGQFAKIEKLIVVWQIEHIDHIKYMRLIDFVISKMNISETHNYYNHALWNSLVWCIMFLS